MNCYICNNDLLGFTTAINNESIDFDYADYVDEAGIEKPICLHCLVKAHNQVAPEDEQI